MARYLCVILSIATCVVAVHLAVPNIPATPSENRSISRPLYIADEFPGFPVDWNRVCWREKTLGTYSYLSSLSPEIKENLLHIKCMIDPMRGQLLYSDLREWSNTLGRKVSLDIVCSESTEASKYGTINLPWPMKARNVVSLTVSKCKVADYFSEYYSVHSLNISDELRVLEMKDIVVLYNVAKLPDLVQNLTRVSLDVDCGQKTLERFVERGVAFEFDFDYELDPTLTWDNFTDVVDLDSVIENIMSYINNRTNTCNYKNLRYLEDSDRDVSSVYHFHLLTMNSLYPKLTGLNFANIGLLEIPKQLQIWPSHFPELQHLNLSHNHISRFHFKDSTNTRRTNTGDMVVDLSYNNVSALSLEDIENLLSQTTIFVNLKANPITVECNFILQLNYMLSSRAGLHAKVSRSKYHYLLTKTPFCSQFLQYGGNGYSYKYSKYAYFTIPLAISCIAAFVIF